MKIAIHTTPLSLLGPHPNIDLYREKALLESSQGASAIFFSPYPRDFHAGILHNTSREKTLTTLPPDILIGLGAIVNHKPTYWMIYQGKILFEGTEGSFFLHDLPVAIFSSASLSDLTTSLEKLPSLSTRSLLINLSSLFFSQETHNASENILHRFLNNRKEIYLSLPVLGLYENKIYPGGPEFFFQNTLWSTPPFKQHTALLNLEHMDSNSSQPRSFSSTFNLFTPSSSPSFLFTLSQALVFGIQNFCLSQGFTKIHLGLSGGIDSALVAYLAVQALGKENVQPIFMPSQYTSPLSYQCAQELCDLLGLSCLTIPIDSLKDHFENLFIPSHVLSESSKDSPSSTLLSLTQENLQARIRAVFLLMYANQNHSLLLTTGNKSEIALGYYTLYGDSAGFLSPLGDLYKTQVFALCRFLNSVKPSIPQVIMDRAPSAELFHGQNDEQGIGFSYEELDEMIQNIARIFPEMPQDSKQKKLLERIQKAEYKRRQSALILKTSLKTFGEEIKFPLR